VLEVEDEDGRAEQEEQEAHRRVEDAPGGDGELMAALVAIIQAALKYTRDALGLATRAVRAVWPAQVFQVIAAMIFAAKVFNELNEVGVHRL
jgi:hypothetical protein